MWIVNLALRRPYTFVVMALLILVLGTTAVVNMRTDIFLVEIDIPVITVLWTYKGMETSELESRITTYSEYAITSNVNNIRRVESQTLNGVGVIRIYFHPGTNVGAAMAQVTSVSQAIRSVMPPGVQPPIIVQFNASSVPILQIALSSQTMSEAEVYDYGLYILRTHLSVVQGLTMPTPSGGRERQIMVDIDPQALQAKGIDPQEVANAVNAFNLASPTGVARIDTQEYPVTLNNTPPTVAAFNSIPIKVVNGSTVFMRDVAQVRDGANTQTTLVRKNGERGALVTLLKNGNASTLDIVAQVKELLPAIQASAPDEIDIQLLFDQSLFVTAAIAGVVNESVIAGLLTATMILLFLGSWRSTLIIAVSIPLSILSSIFLLFALAACRSIPPRPPRRPGGLDAPAIVRELIPRGSYGGGAMAMGRRKTERQDALFITADNLPKSQGHPFYQALNRLLADAGFDRWIEARCDPYYEQVETRGQRSIPPGTYFRMLLVGYFEGIDSQRGIAWRCADSLSLRQFLGLTLEENSPDHSTLSITRRRLPAEVFAEVFQFVLKIAAEKKLLSGKTVGVDSTTLEADAAMKSIVRRDTGENWKAYVTRLMREEGVIAKDDEPTDEDARRFDRNRKDKKVSNEEWFSPTDPDAKITKMKDGTTHLAYKAEHVVDLDSDLILAAEIRPTTDADTQTLADSVLKAEENLQAIGAEQSIEEVVADKGYHAAGALELCHSLDLRTYIPEPKRTSDWDWTERTSEQQRAVHGNRRRVKRAKGKQLQKRRSELCERSFAHVCETGGMRRTWLRGLVDVTKRYLIATAAHNLGRVLRTLFGVGKPRTLQGSGEGGESGAGTLAAGFFGDLTPLWHILARHAMLARSWPHRLALSSATARRAPALAG